MDPLEPLGTVRTTGWDLQRSILTSRQYWPSSKGMVAIETWTPIPDEMSAEDLGRKFLAASTTVMLLPVPKREELQVG